MIFSKQKALFPIWGDDAGKEGKLLFTRKEVFPLSPRPSLPFKKSGTTFLFTFTYPCREQSQTTILLPGILHSGGASQRVYYFLPTIFSTK